VLIKKVWHSEIVPDLFFTSKLKLPLIYSGIGGMRSTGVADKGLF
jgi:hypothetical protein